jgi:hypothetical protein
VFEIIPDGRDETLCGCFRSLGLTAECHKAQEEQEDFHLEDSYKVQTAMEEEGESERSAPSVEGSPRF